MFTRRKKLAKATAERRRRQAARQDRHECDALEARCEDLIDKSTGIEKVRAINMLYWFRMKRSLHSAIALLLLCVPAQAEVLDFVAHGRGLDPLRTNRITGKIAYNPGTDTITSVHRLSYQGLQEWEVGRMDPRRPFSGTYDGQSVTLTGFGGLDRHEADCGKIASLSVSGDVYSGDMSFSLLYPDEVPGGCPLSGHLAEGRTTTSVAFESVPEPSSIALTILGLICVAAFWRK